jgi:hypothetical protein
VEIPEPVRAADEALYALLRRVAFSRHLNPINGTQVLRQFQRNQEPPCFEYEPLDNADSLKRELDSIMPGADHPAGELVCKAIASVHRLIHALDVRSADAFDAMNKAAGWYPDSELLAGEYTAGSPIGPVDVPASELINHFSLAFQARGMSDWRITEDEVMSARVLVDSAKRLVRVNPKSMFRHNDLSRLVVHEIDVHARRATNGEKQPLWCFVTGLPGSLATEEGLAMVAEETSGTASLGVLARQAEVVWAIDKARSMGFRALYYSLCGRVGPGLAWGICVRVKRGLSHPEEPGVYAKDSVYLAGRNKVRKWLDAGGDIQCLYVGKVGVEDPVRDWLDQGWVKPQPVPALWSS